MAWAAQPIGQTLSISNSRTPDTFIDTVLPNLSTYTYQTRLLGLLDGDPTYYYDQTFGSPFADASVQTGIGVAMSALLAANAGNPLTFLPPQLDSSVTTPLTSNTVTTQIGDPVISETVTLLETIGPGFLPIGDLGTCTGLSGSAPSGAGYGGAQDLSLGGLYPFGCTGGAGLSFSVVAESANLNVNTNFQYQFTRQIQTTDTYQVFDTWRLTGVSQSPPTSVPEPGTLALLLMGVLGLGLTRRRKLSR